MHDGDIVCRKTKRAETNVEELKKFLVFHRMGQAEGLVRVLWEGGAANVLGSLQSLYEMGSIQFAPGSANANSRKKRHNLKSKLARKSRDREGNFNDLAHGEVHRRDTNTPTCETETTRRLR